MDIGLESLLDSDREVIVEDVEPPLWRRFLLPSAQQLTSRRQAKRKADNQ
jgi:hypothetical protein